MPVRKRFFPVSHSFNRDPEIRELRLKYADWMGYVWQEMCSIGDMNGGIVKGSPEQIGASLAYISLLKRPSLAAKCITNALGFMEKCGWIVVETDRVLIVNHLKYHKTEEQKKLPPNQTEPNLPNQTIKEDGPATPALVDKSKPKTPEPPKWRAVADTIYKSDPARFARLVQFIRWAESKDYSECVISGALDDLWNQVKKHSVNGNWWPYVKKLAEKRYAEEQQNVSAKVKADERRFIAACIGVASK